MIGVFAAHSGRFLRVMAVLTLVVFSIPVGLMPLAWARTFRWSVGAEPNLALYFGRCLGALAVVQSCAAWYAANHSDVQRFYFATLIAGTALLAVAHIVGAVQGVQPWTETAEIPFWGGFALLGLLFFPVR